MPKHRRAARALRRRTLGRRWHECAVDGQPAAGRREGVAGAHRVGADVDPIDLAELVTDAHVLVVCALPRHRVYHHLPLAVDAQQDAPRRARMHMLDGKLDLRRGDDGGRELAQREHGAVAILGDRPARRQLLRAPDLQKDAARDALEALLAVLDGAHRARADADHAVARLEAGGGALGGDLGDDHHRPLGDHHTGHVVLGKHRKLEAERLVLGLALQLDVQLLCCPRRDQPRGRFAAVIVVRQNGRRRPWFAAKRQSAREPLEGALQLDRHVGRRCAPQISDKTFACSRGGSVSERDWKTNAKHERP